MKELIEFINRSFSERTGDISLQREAWTRLSSQFRPDISQYRSIRPSTLIARETGDIGLAVLWIVETFLARPILSDISLNSEINPVLSGIMSRVDSGSICALAHSESRENPAVLSGPDGTLTLRGEKKFITAGANADLILVSCRNPGEEKVSRIALLEKKDIPHESLVDLRLDIFKSVNHSKLVLDGLEIGEEAIPSIDPSLLRRSLKKWGIIERALIMESFISYLIYVNRLFAGKNIIITTDEELITLEQAQGESAGRQIEEAVYAKKVETQNIPPAGVFTILQRFKEKYAGLKEKFTGTERLKLLDLNLFDSMKG